MRSRLWSRPLLPSAAKKTGGTDNTLLQGILEKLTANAEYSQWKFGFGATTIEEKLDGDSIVISAKGEEGVNGDSCT